MVVRRGEWVQSPAFSETDGAAEDWLAHFLSSAVNEAVHEALEHFHVDGKPWLDPHGWHEDTIHSLANEFAEKLAELDTKKRERIKNMDDSTQQNISVDYAAMELRMALLKGVDTETADRITATVVQAVRTVTLQETVAHLNDHQIEIARHTLENELVPNTLTGGLALAEDMVRSMIPGEHIAWTEKIR